MIFTARSLRGRDGLEGLQPVINAVLKRLEAHGSPDVYMTFDIDCLDPAFAPGTGTPEPGGLTTTQALTLVEGFCAFLGEKLIGFDVVEVSPPYDHAELTTSAAATLAWTYLSAQAAVRSKGVAKAQAMWLAAMQLPHQ
jgi:agmatinase